jgi:hypothetical protein
LASFNSLIGCASLASHTEGLMTRNDILRSLPGGRLFATSVASLVAFVIVTTSAPAAQMLPFYDSMDGYTQGERLGGTTSVGTWDVGNSTGTGSAEIRAEAALTYPGLEPEGDPAGKGIWSSGIPGSNRDRGVGFLQSNPPDPPVTLSASDRTIYASFLMNVQAGPSVDNRLLAGFRGTSGGGGFTPKMGLFITPDRELAVSRHSTTPAAGRTSPLSLDTTNLVVMGYKYVDGGADDQVSVWVNPPISGAPPTPDLTVDTGGTGDPNFWNFQFTLRNTAAQNGGGTYYFDEVRIGKAWADVAPVPEPASAGLIGLGFVALVSMVRRRR